jgi:hypothetical protein
MVKCLSADKLAMLSVDLLLKFLVLAIRRREELIDINPAFFVLRGVMVAVHDLHLNGGEVTRIITRHWIFTIHNVLARRKKLHQNGK